MTPRAYSPMGWGFARRAGVVCASMGAGLGTGLGTGCAGVSHQAFRPPVVLPPAPNSGDIPRPSGAVGGLSVLDWAGFTAAISYTFDDTNSSQIENYDALDELGVRFSFYLQTNKPEANDPVWARALQAGHELGNHSHTHQREDDGRDVDAANAFIAKTFGVTPVTMAAPYGSSAYVELAKTRFIINRGVNNGLISPTDATNPFELPCFIPNEGASAGDFNAQVDTARSARKWQTVLVHGFSGGSDAAYQPVDLEQFVAAVRYAKSLGDVWIDSVVNVGAYWLGHQTLLAAIAANSQDAKHGTEQTWNWTLPAHFPSGHRLRVTVTGGTLTQDGIPVPWDPHGYYEISLDAKNLTLGT